MRFYSDSAPTMEDPATAAARAAQAKAGTGGALAAGAAVGYMLRGGIGALIGAALAYWNTQKTK